MGEFINAPLRGRVDDTILRIAQGINRALKVKILFLIGRDCLREDDLGVTIANKFVCGLINLISKRAIHARN